MIRYEEKDVIAYSMLVLKADLIIGFFCGQFHFNEQKLKIVLYDYCSKAGSDIIKICNSGKSIPLKSRQN